MLPWCEAAGRAGAGLARIQPNASSLKKLYRLLTITNDLFNFISRAEPSGLRISEYTIGSDI